MMMRNLLLQISCGLLIWLLAPPASCGGPLGDQEHEIKAAYIYNFTKFVEWPNDAAPARAPSFSIGVLGSNPFGTALANAVENKSAGGKSIVVEYFTSVAALRQIARLTDILFIGPLAADSLSLAIGYVQDFPVLTIGEGDGFCARGGIIAFVREKNRIRFEINTAAAGRAKLKISSKLLQLAARAEERP